MSINSEEEYCLEKLKEMTLVNDVKLMIVIRKQLYARKQENYAMTTIRAIHTT